MKNKWVSRALIVASIGGLVALGLGSNWAIKGLNLRQYVLETWERDCLESSVLFDKLSMNDVLRSDPERWDIVAECAVFVDSIDKATPYLIFMTEREGDWASTEVKDASWTAYEAFIVRAKAVKSEIENAN